jgi:hypothetical protein
MPMRALRQPRAPSANARRAAKATLKVTCIEVPVMLRYALPACGEGVTPSFLPGRTSPSGRGAA